MIVIDKFHSLGLAWWAWPTIGVAIAVVASGAWARWRTRNLVEVAQEIDSRFGLHERVSSSLAMSDVERATPVGQALLHDATERVRRLAIGDEFHLRPTRWTLLPVVGCALAAAVALLWQPAASESRSTKPDPQVVARQQAVKQSSETLRRKIVEQKHEAEKLGLKSAEELFSKLENGTRQLAQSPEADRKKALASLNDLAKELEKRRQALAGQQAMQEQFQKMKPFANGPADRMGEALRKGDAQQALNEVKKLQEALARGDMDAQAREDLARQLADMEQKIRDAAQAQQQAIDQQKDRIAQERAAGNAAAAEQLEQRLAEMQKQQGQRQPIDALAKQLGAAGEALKQGDADAARQQLDQLAQNLDTLQQQAAEDQMLGEALDQMQLAKDQMNCKECQGNGCEACQGPGGKVPGNGRFGQGQGGGQGNGIGNGRGRDLPPDKQPDTGVFDTRVRQKVGRGPARITDFVEGPNAKGQVQQEIRTQWQAVEGDSTDPLSDQPLPRDYREHTKKYFDALREGR
jgi:hypothetical protein